MMTMIVVLAVLLIVALIIMTKIEETYQNHIEKMTRLHHEQLSELIYSFQEERSGLLDRIQAPTFGEYKNAEIKMVKAQKDEEPKPSFILE